MLVTSETLFGEFYGWNKNDAFGEMHHFFLASYLKSPLFLGESE
jgi:hypothetical protein